MIGLETNTTVHVSTYTVQLCYFIFLIRVLLKYIYLPFLSSYPNTTIGHVCRLEMKRKPSGIFLLRSLAQPLTEMKKIHCQTLKKYEINFFTGILRL